MPKSLSKLRLGVSRAAQVIQQAGSPARIRLERRSGPTSRFPSNQPGIEWRCQSVDSLDRCPVERNLPRSPTFDPRLRGRTAAANSSTCAARFYGQSEMPLPARRDRHRGAGDPDIGAAHPAVGEPLR